MESSRVSLLDNRENRKKHTISRRREPPVGTAGAILVLRLGTDLLLDLWVGQIVLVRVGRVGVVGWCADVVDVEVAAVADGVLDPHRAGLAGGRAQVIVLVLETFLQGGEAVALKDFIVAVTVGLVDELAVGVVEGEVNVGLLLDLGIKEAVVDAQSDQVDLLSLDGAGRDLLVLVLDVVGKARSIVATVGLVILAWSRLP